MKKIALLVLSSVLLLSFFAAFAAVEDSTEKDVIKKAITDYYYGGQKGSNPKLLDQIFHEEWHLYSIREGKLSITDKKTYLGYFDPSKANPDLNWDFEVYYVDVDGHAASAKVRLENDRVRFIDYFNMLKIDGKWWIVNKISFPTRK